VYRGCTCIRKGKKKQMGLAQVIGAALRADWVGRDESRQISPLLSVEVEHQRPFFGPNAKAHIRSTSEIKKPPVRRRLTSCAERNRRVPSPAGGAARRGRVSGSLIAWMPDTLTAIKRVELRVALGSLSRSLLPAAPPPLGRPSRASPIRRSVWLSLPSVLLAILTVVQRRHTAQPHGRNPTPPAPPGRTPLTCSLLPPARRLPWRWRVATDRQALR